MVIAIFPAVGSFSVSLRLTEKCGLAKPFVLFKDYNNNFPGSPAWFTVSKPREQTSKSPPRADLLANTIHSPALCMIINSHYEPRLANFLWVCLLYFTRCLNLLTLTRVKDEARQAGLKSPPALCNYYISTLLPAISAGLSQWALGPLPPPPPGESSGRCRLLPVRHTGQPNADLLSHLAYADLAFPYSIIVLCNNMIANNIIIWFDVCV